MNIRLPKMGDRVNIIEKRNYGSGKLTTGVVKKLLSDPHEVHPRGNKVMLEDGTVGRTVSFVDEVGVQTFVDPALREEYTREIRAARSNEGRQSPRRFQDRKPFVKREDFRRGPAERNEPAEPPVDFSNLPGEDDLR